jgi:hypothetical protein
MNNLHRVESKGEMDDLEAKRGKYSFLIIFLTFIRTYESGRDDVRSIESIIIILISRIL